MFCVNGLKLLFSVLLLTLCLCLTGCLKSKVVVKVRSDGSGDIVVTQIFSRELVSLYDAHVKKAAEAGEPNSMPDPFYNEDMIRKMASRYGKGVTFVKSLKYDKEGARGFVAQYSFADIGKVHLDLKIEMPDNFEPPMEDGDNSADAVPSENPDVFRFAFEKTQGLAKLTVIAPTIPEKDISQTAASEEQETPEMLKAQIQELMQDGNPFGLAGDETKEQLIKKFLGGVKIVYALEVDGSVVQSGLSKIASDKSSRFILLDLDMANILKKLSNEPAEMGCGVSLLNLYAELPESPGFVIEKAKDGFIEFK